MASVDTDFHPTPGTPQLTVRAILTGMTLGALLVPCNVYSGLKIGWSFNMSITAALLSLAFWRLSEKLAGTRPWGLYENNINQTAASAGASIVSAGLVAPIPALAMLTGERLPWGVLAVWTFAISAMGLVVAVGLRRQMLVTEKLTFPAGVATAEVMQDIYAHGREAAARLKMLTASALVAGTVKALEVSTSLIGKLGFPAAVGGGTATGALQMAGYKQVTLKNLGFVLDPSLLMVGFGAIVGARVGVSLLLGAVFAWGVLGPWALAQGWAEAGANDPGAYWFGDMVKWLLWPGVTLMVTASLTTFTFSAWRALRQRRQRAAAGEFETMMTDGTWRGFRVGLVASMALVVIAQVTLFDITWPMAILAVVLTFLLAIVAARVSGETGIPPIGALGKVTQLTFGVLSPASATTNLMSANVTGGAAGQCSDLLHDFKTGLLIHASPRLQSIAQVFGILTGSLVGTAAYLFLIPDPQAMLLTAEWPAPAVATWKAVAEVFQQGLGALPAGAVPAMALAGAAGLCLALLEQFLPASQNRWLPSAASLGLAFIIPAWVSISMFIGGLLSWALKRCVADWHRRFLVVLAAGLVAGESLAGVGHALLQLLSY
ncbi:OPT family oligopeptide transporter [Nitrospina watsonii]|uniref:Oligopeptide transporter, OPT superfamily n=1 Tax=Nitrospina watsonii TaxID=1323948 RepID=A0ABN8W775_9BACT|nr:OPT family oligopeptide transporter [Nitrospina watsonii]CAI2719501.1 Oligopeptide transporter, OPT superfamily [Nitrospina watsonii]